MSSQEKAHHRRKGWQEIHQTGRGRKEVVQRTEKREQKLHNLTPHTGFQSSKRVAGYQIVTENEHQREVLGGDKEGPWRRGDTSEVGDRRSSDHKAGTVSQDPNTFTINETT
jgi:hypothetical protein